MNISMVLTVLSHITAVRIMFAIGIAVTALPIFLYKMSKTKGDGLRKLRNYAAVLGIAMCLPMVYYIYADIRYDLGNFSMNDKLYLAAENKNLGAAKQFLEDGSVPDGDNRYGKTAIARAVELDDVQMTRLFLEWGADPNSPCGEEKTLLGEAAGNLCAENVELLLSMGASPDYRTDLYIPAIHFAAVNDKEYSADIIEMLVKGGADPASKAVVNGKVMLPYRYYHDVHKDDHDITEEEEERFQRISDLLYRPYIEWLNEKMTSGNESAVTE